MAYIVEEVAPLAEPLLLADVKNYLKVNVSNDDAFIQELIQSAREEVEGFTGRSLINKGYRQDLDAFPYFVDTVMSQMAYPPSYYSLPRYSTTLWNYSQMIKLLRSPLQQVTKITYSDSVTGQIDALYPALFSWEPLTEYNVGDQIEDSNGNLQVVTAVSQADEDSTSMSGPTAPTWSVTVGQPTTDAMLTWTCMGPPPDSGDFVYDADTVPARIFPLPGQTWPPVLYVPNAVQIHFVAGYGNNGKAVPATLRTAMRLLIADGYYNREPVVAGTIAETPALKRMLYRWKVQIKSATRG
jgi:Phage gp6-like head-tail connector protein